jgi:hypothetical protein
MPSFDDKKDQSSEYPFHGGKPPIDQESLENFTGPLRPAESSLKIIDHLLKNPEQYSFEKIRDLKEYLDGEKFALNSNEAPGALRFHHLFTKDPTPAISEPARVYQVYRLAVLQHCLDSKLVFKPVFTPEYLELESGGTIDAKLAKTIVRDTSERAESPLALKKVIAWPIRVSPGSEISVTRDVLNAGYIQIQDAEKIGHSRFQDASQYLIGNNTSLGQLGNPFGIRMKDIHLKSDKTEPLKDDWKNKIEAHAADGAHLKVGLDRNRVILGHKSVTIRNEGDVPFIVHFELREWRGR